MNVTLSCHCFLVFSCWLTDGQRKTIDVYIVKHWEFCPFQGWCKKRLKLKFVQLKNLIRSWRVPEELDDLVVEQLYFVR